jgi:Putative addiction module component
MTATLEHIKREIRNLEPSEVEILLRDLQFEYIMPLPEGGDEVSVEAAWDTEIDARVKDIEDGKVELISGQDFNSHVDQLFARHGLARTQRA